jgi:hypothetical protein
MLVERIKEFFRYRDGRWLTLYCAGVLFIAVWDTLFLNKPALKLVISGFVNTGIVALLVVVFTLVFAWSVALVLHFLEVRKHKIEYLCVMFVLNMIRSIPQIVGVLFGYVGVGLLVQNNVITNNLAVFVLLALCISIFVFIEFVDLLRERIAHFCKLDFYSAMRVCGISESRIVNIDILWKNSRIHIFNKLISIFGVAIFLQCSVDFIISVGLSTDVNSSTLPVTMGCLLANIDSKQDVLAIGSVLTHPAYVSSLFFEHLQGVTVAFLIVFTLLSIYHIANGYAERHRL